MATPASDLLEVFSTYDGSTLFRGLVQGVSGQPPVLGRLGWLFTGLGAAMVLWGFVLRSGRSQGHGKLDEIARTWLVVAAILAAPLFLRSSMQAADTLYVEAVGGPGALTSACVKAAYAMPELTLLFDALRASGGRQAPASSGDLVSQVNDGSALGYLEAFGAALWDTGRDYASAAGQTWNGVVRMATLATGFGAAMLKCLLILLTVGPLYLLLLLSATLIWFMQQLRFFLAVTGSMMMPLFIGLYALPEGHPSRQAAHAYVMHMVSVALWPVAWAVGHTGTIALYDALIALVAGTSRVPDMATFLSWDALGAQSPSPAQLASLQGALGTWFNGNVASLLAILVGALGFAAWVAAVSIMGPVVLHRSLTGGAHYFADLAGMSGRATGAVLRTAGGAAYPLIAGPALSAAQPAAGERLASARGVDALAVTGGEPHRPAGSTMAEAAKGVDVSGGKAPRGL
jgi:hypothetical protein